MLQKEVFPKIKNSKVFGNNNIKFNLGAKLSDSKINIISQEGFSSRPFAYPNSESSESCFTIAKRLHNIFPSAKIIVVFREKESLLKSWYSEYIKHGGFLDYDDWFESWTNYDVLNFDEYKKLLEDLFDSVLVLNFNQLKNDPTRFVGTICDYIGVKPPVLGVKKRNIKLDGKSIKRWKKWNYRFKSDYNPDGFIPINFLWLYEKIRRKI